MARGDAITGKSDSAQLDQLLREFERIKEKVEKMTGERGDGQRTLSSVRRGELQVLASQELSSQQIASSPTQADYNALQADVAKIFNALARISNLLGNATIPKV